MTDMNFVDMFAYTGLGTQTFLFLERELVRYDYMVEYRLREAFFDDINSPAFISSPPDAIILAVVGTRDFLMVTKPLHRFQRRIGRRRTKILLATGSNKRTPAGIIHLCTGHVTTSHARRTAAAVKSLNCRRLTLFHKATPEQIWTLPARLKILNELERLDPSITSQVAIVLSDEVRDGAELADHAVAHFAPEAHHLENLLGHRRYLTLRKWAATWQSSRQLAPLLLPALDSDLWIFDSDAHAAEALSWLQRKGIKVPKDLMVMGLENRQEYFHLGLTSCVPDWQAIGYLMAHALIGDIPIARTSHGFLRTEALLLPRQTTVIDSP